MLHFEASYKSVSLILSLPNQLCAKSQLHVILCTKMKTMQLPTQVARLCCMLILAISVGVVSCSPQWKASQHGWKRADQSRAHVMRYQDHRLIFRFRPRDANAIHTAIAHVSDPNSDQFRQYLDDAVISALVAPTPTSHATLQRWLRTVMPTNGSYFVDLSPHGDYAFVSAKVWQWESIFGAFALYQNGESEIMRLVRMLPSFPTWSYVMLLYQNNCVIFLRIRCTITLCHQSLLVIVDDRR